MQMTWGTLNKILTNHAAVKKTPLTGRFELTPRCNLQCKMCYVCRSSKDKEALKNELSSDQWIKLAREARDAGVLFLTLTGGEIFLIKDFRKIYEEISKMGFNLQLYTNATLITPEIAKWLGKNQPSKVSITIYGASNKTYEAITGNAKGFDLTMRGIDALIAEGITIELKTTVIKGNMSEFDQLVAIADERKVEFGIVNYVSPRREGDNSDPIANRLSPKEIALFDFQLQEYNLEKIEQNKERLLIKEDFAESENIIPLIKTEESVFDCIAGSCGFWVTWDGRLTPCGLLDKPDANPVEDGFLNAWEKLIVSVKDIPSCITCKECNLKTSCLTCPARLKTETGFFDKAAEYLCESVKERVTLENNKKSAIG